MIKTQDPKYNIDSAGKLVNAATGVPIPEDEPVFMLRAKDMYALDTLLFYMTRVDHIDGHRDGVAQRIEDFQRFRAEQSDQIREPTT